MEFELSLRERIKIGDIVLEVCNVKGDRASIGITAPRHVPVRRGELQAEDLEADSKVELP